MTKTIVTIGLIILFVIAASVLFVIYFQQPSITPVPQVQNQNVNSENNQQETFGIPESLSIPTINVEAAITSAGLAKDGSVAVPDGPHGVNWYNMGPKPGEMGSAILTGHFGPWATGAKSVFDNLNKLKAGDKIYVKDDQGKLLTFVVQETKTYGLNEKPTEIFTKNDKAYLNLITCSGEWLKDQKTYTNRLVVFTELEAN